MPETRTADAVVLPAGFRQGPRQVDRLNFILDFAEPLLGSKGYVRRQPDETLFVTRDPRDTLYFPKGHPREGYPRYEWVDGDGGVKVGYLLKDQP